MSAAVTIKTESKTALRVLTNSEFREARACLRRHHFKYGLKRRPRTNAEPLTFGTLFHKGQEAWHSLWNRPAEERYNAAIEAIRAAAVKAAERGEPLSEYAIVTCEELTLGYTARWGDDSFRTIAVERSFEMPLVNPATGAASRTFQLGGKVDAIVQTPDGKLHVLEHKTTGSDIELGSLYWEKVRALDTQVSQYIAGAKAIGFDVEDCIYDVVRKPGIKPLKATPEESRKYTKPKMKDGVVVEPSRLYADQRETDETPEEFRFRLRQDILARPDRYFARGTVVRLEAEERDHAFDVWQAAKMINEAERSGYRPKNPDACASFGGCLYLPVCSGQASINDDRIFRTADVAHEELQSEV